MAMTRDNKAIVNFYFFIFFCLQSRVDAMQSYNSKLDDEYVIHGKIIIAGRFTRRNYCLPIYLLWLCFCPKMTSEAISEDLYTFESFLGDHSIILPDSLSLACIHAHQASYRIYVTPLWKKILATDLFVAAPDRTQA